MATNKSLNKSMQRQQNAAKEKRRAEYENKHKKLYPIFLTIFGVTLAVALVTLIVTLCADVVFVGNPDVKAPKAGEVGKAGREVWVSGSAFLKALFTGTYTSAASGYDNLAVPFYYDAQKYCKPAAVFTFITVLASAAAIVATAVVLVRSILKKEVKLSWLSLGASALNFLTVVITFAIAISMKNGTILSRYCGGNPRCTIESDLAACLVLSALMFAANIVALILQFKLEKQRKEIE